MTMLDRMRRHKGWLKWSLAIVVLAFIFLYIPSFLDEPGAAGLNDVVASVDGRNITVARFRRTYQQQMQSYRAAYGGNVDERLLKQLGLDQRIVQQMIEEETALAEAAAAGHLRDRRGSPGAHCRAARPPGERPFHRRSALPADAADAATRRCGRMSSKRRSAAA